MSGVVWTDTVTPLNAANMSQLEQIVRKGAANGYASLDGTTKVPVAQLPTIPLAGITPGANGQWLKTAGGVPVWSAITPADVGTVKITTSAFASGPPASPTDGDIWCATSVDAAGGAVRWTFQYDSSQATYKWLFVGGNVWANAQTVAQSLSSGVWQNVSPTLIQLRRAGAYWMTATGTYVNNGGTNTVSYLSIYKGTASAGNGLSHAAVSALLASLYANETVPGHYETVNANDSFGMMAFVSQASCQFTSGALSVLPFSVI